MGRVDAAQRRRGGEWWGRCAESALERGFPTPAGFASSTLPMKGREKPRQNPLAIASGALFSLRAVRLLSALT